jgi:hypothetical protein
MLDSRTCASPAQDMISARILAFRGNGFVNSDPLSSKILEILIGKARGRKKSKPFL